MEKKERPKCPKKNEEPKKPIEPERPGSAGKNCYTLKKHPSAASEMYKARVCIDPDKNKKKCPPPIEVCKDPDLNDPCAFKKKKKSATAVVDAVDVEDEVMPERPKPPRCPPKEDPCANDDKPKLCACPSNSNANYSCGKRDDDD